MPLSPATFRAPRSFHPPSSLLGRGLQRWIGDPLRAEATYWIVLVLTVAVAVMGTQWGWLWLHDSIPLDDFPNVALWYAGVQAVALVAFVLVAYAGWRPAVAVTLTDDRLHFAQGPSTLEVPRTSLRAVRPVDATEEHRTLRRRADVRRFVAKAYDPLLVLDVEGGSPVVLALPIAERERFEHALDPTTRDLRPTTHQ